MTRLLNLRRGTTLASCAVALALLLAAPSVQANANLGNEAAFPVHARQHGRLIRRQFSFPFDTARTTTTPLASTTTLPLSTTPIQTTSLDSCFGPACTSTTSQSSASTTSSSLPSSSPSPTSIFSNTTTTSTSTLVHNTTTSITSTTSILTSTTQSPDVPGTTSTVVVAGSLSKTSATETPTGDPSFAAAHSVAIARKTIVALIAITGSIGLAFLIWTGIRKWKFRPSRGFEDRMQDPINWQPSAVDYDERDPATRIAANHRSAGSHESFGSSDLPQNNSVQPMQYNNGYGATGATGLNRSLSGRVTTNQHFSDVPPLPPHDFTDPPAVGNRSETYDPYYVQTQQHMPGMSSSPPQMVENGLTRGATVVRSVSVRSENPYDGLDDDYGHQPSMPPHHGGAYAVPSAPPPYHTGL